MEIKTEKIKAFLESKNFFKVICVIGGLLVVLLIFEAGMLVGFRKASFAYRYGESYYNTFGHLRGGTMMNLMPLDREFGEAHGAAGKIIKIALPTFFVLDNSGIEKPVLINDDTVIRKFRESLKPEDLKVGDFVVIIGAPDDNSLLEARLIRLMQLPSSIPSATTTNNK